PGSARSSRDSSSDEADLAVLARRLVRRFRLAAAARTRPRGGTGSSLRRGLARRRDRGNRPPGEGPRRHVDPSSQFRDPRRDVAEPGIVVVYCLVLLQRLRVEPPRLVDDAELEVQGVARRRGEVGQLEALLEMADCGFGVAAFRLAQTEHGEGVRRPRAAAVAEGHLELRDRLVEKPHLLVCDAEIVMRLYVFGPHQLLNLGAK